MVSYNEVGGDSVETVYIFSSGELKRKDNIIVLISEDGSKKHIPIENVDEIKVFGEVTLNKRFLEFLTKKQVIVHFFNRNGYYTGTYYPRESNSTGITFLKQAQHYLNPHKRLEIARKIVEGASKNMIGFLKVHGCKNYVEKIKALKTKLKGAFTIQQLMGIEGNIRDMYYSAFDEIIKDDNFKVKRREKRPPTNCMNTLISFGNSLLYTTTLSEIFKTHLDPRIGFLHETNQRRFSLHLDISEIFKPVIVDRVIFRMINRGQIKPKHFSKITGGMKLTEEGKQIFSKEYQKRLSETLRHGRLKRKVSYKTLIRLEAYKIEKHILEIEEYSPYTHKN